MTRSGEVEDQTADPAVAEAQPTLRPRARTALAIFSLLVLFVAIFITAVGLCGEQIYTFARAKSQAEAERSLTTAVQNYKSQPGRSQARRLSQIFVAAAFAELDPDAYLKSRLWRSLRAGMTLRLALGVLSFIAVILMLCRRLAGQRLLLATFLGLTVIGGLESLVILRDLRLFADEYGRDLGASFQAVVAESGLSEQFPPMFQRLPILDSLSLRKFSLGYFFVSTVAWQVLLLILVAGRSTERQLTKETR